MSYSVGTLWGIYVIVVVIAFIIFWLLLDSARYYYRSVSYGTAFFLATLLGAIAVFIGAAWLDPNQLSDSDKTWLSVLFIVAFLLPIFVIFYIVWAGEYAAITGEESCMPKWCKKSCEKPCKKSCENKDPCKDKSYTKKTIHCDSDTGICHVKKKKVYQGDDVTTVIYSSPNE